MEKKIFELITGEKNIIKRIFIFLSILPDRRLRKEYNEYRKVWRLLDNLPTYKKERRMIPILYPAFVFSLILILLGIYVGKNSYKYQEYITLTEEVIYFEE